MTIHTALVAKQSPALNSLVSGSMEEAQTKMAIWEDVDEETFGLFAQFAYTGDYTPPSFVKGSSRRSSIGDEPNGKLPAVTAYGRQILAEAEENDYFSSSKRDKKKKKRASTFGWGDFLNEEPAPEPRPPSPAVPEPSPPLVSRPDFHNRTYPLLTPTTATAPRPNESSSEDYTPVFLSHARLYVFAETYDIPPLQTLALSKLHRTLCTFTLYAARYGDIIALARYVYANTPSRRVMDPLREMLVQYIAFEATSVARCAQCMELVEENGSFASDLLRMLLERVA